MFGRRVFSVEGPLAWNSLPDYLLDPTRSFDSFRRDLKTFLVVVLLAYIQCIRGYINLLLTLIFV